MSSSIKSIKTFMAGVASMAGMAAIATQQLAHSQQPTTLSAERIKNDVLILSSDKFEGRAPSSRGEELTIDHLEKEMKAAGLKPAGEKGTFFQNVPLIKVVTDQASTLEIKQGEQLTPFRMGDDFSGTTHTQKEQETFDAEVVFVGHGISAPEFNWDDYKDIDVKGKIVLLFTNEPPSEKDDFFGGKALTYYGRWTYKFEEAARRGAKGCLIIHTNDTAGYPYTVVRVNDGFQLQLKEGVPELAYAGWLSQKAGEKLLEFKGKTVQSALDEANTKGFKPYSLGVNIKGDIKSKVTKTVSKNVVGMIEGSDPKLKDEFVVFTAHWDHLGVGQAIVGDTIYNGAADNGTGTALLLELARAWAKLPAKPKRSVLFLSVTAEEKGLLGSKYYAENPLIPLNKTALNLNFDMIMPLGIPEMIVLNGSERTTIWPAVQNVAKKAGLEIEPDPRSHLGIFYRSDHFSMARAGVPAFSVAAGSKLRGKPADLSKKVMQEFTERRYHTPQDEVQPDWDFSGFPVVGQFAIDLAIDVANMDKLPNWNKGDEFRPAREKSGVKE